MQQFGAPDEVYAGPASPFVYHFLGDVNLFHGRVREGRAWIGEIAVDLEHLDGVDDVPAQVYAPHEIDVDRHRNGGGIEGVVRDVRPLGDVVRIELERREAPGASRSSSRASVMGSRGSPRASGSISGRAIRRYFSKPGCR